MTIKPVSILLTVYFALSNYAVVAEELASGNASKSANTSAGNVCNPGTHQSKSNPLDPVILYTDILSGPAQGGEQDLGAYLSIFGFNFGDEKQLGVTTHVCINNSEVASYKHMGDAMAQYALPGRKVQKITVQPGKLDNAPHGRPLAVKIIVNTRESKQSHSFTLQPGNIYFIDNLKGDDSEGEVNNPSKPFRYVQTPEYDDYDVISYVQPGDFIVLRGGKPWTDTGVGNRFVRLRRVTGTQPTGDEGTGPITIMGYPGEDVLIQCQVDSSCGIHGVDGYADSKYEKDADWITISNLRIKVGGPKVIDGPINLQHKSDHWRIVNNELFDWDANDEDGKIIDGNVYRAARSGGITGDGEDIKILGNYIHDIDGGYRNHGIYIDGGATNVEIAFNHMEKLFGGNIIQTYDSVGFPDGNSAIKNIQIHHNLLHDSNRYGINIADNTKSALITNNVIYNTDYAGLRFSTASADLIYAAHNTLFNVCRNADSPKYAAINNDWDGNGLHISNNIIVANKSCSGYFFSNTRSEHLLLDNNLYHGLGGSPSRDKKGKSTDPKFINAGRKDFRLSKGSKAINGGIETIQPVRFDYLMNMRDQQQDLGAFEY